MIELEIPGRGTLQLHHLVLDLNGTLAVDGRLVAGLSGRLASLRDRLEIHLLTADTRGNQEEIARQCSIQAVRIHPEAGDEAGQKTAYLNSLGPGTVAAIGQGANDAGMLKSAALGICILSPEGSAVETLLAADLVVADIVTALDLFDQPLRIVASLRK